MRHIEISITHLLLSIILISCSKEHQKKHSSFSSIDITHIDMASNLISLHVDSTGNAIFKYDNLNKQREIYLTGRFSDSLITGINKLADTILNTNYNSVYLDMSPHLSYYNVCINARNKRRFVFVRASNRPKELEDLVSLTLQFFRKSYLQKVDTTFQFETYLLPLSEMEKMYEKERK